MNFMPAPSVHSQAAQRAVGRLDLGFAVTGLRKFYQEGCLKARLPRPAQPGMPEVITLNISGGVAGGDSLATSITLSANARLCVASQAAERIYNAGNCAPARIDTRIALAPGARLDHLPQETILFNGFALNRALHIEMAPDATYLGVESLIFGRQARGEMIGHGSLRDLVSITVGGRPMLRDSTRLEGNIAARLAARAIAGGAVAMGTIIYASPDAPAWLGVVRSALQASGAVAGASLLHNIIFIRILAASAHCLRDCTATILTLCRSGQPLPRVWQS